MHLDTTLEEDVLDAQTQSQSRSRTPSYPHSPVLGVSPPHDVKVRQISQGVEDMKWQQAPQSQQEARSQSQPSLAPSQDAGETQGNIEASQAVFGSQSTQAPPSLPSCVDDATEDAEEAQDTASSLPHTRRASESDGGEPEKGLKRKLADRAASLGPESGPSTATPTAETAKRPRDDSDKDDNPRVSKRPSPPPEQSDEPTPAPETPAPKLVRTPSWRYAVLTSFAGRVHVVRFSSVPVCLCQGTERLLECSTQQSKTIYVTTREASSTAP